VYNAEFGFGEMFELAIMQQSLQRLSNCITKIPQSSFGSRRVPRCTPKWSQNAPDPEMTKNRSKTAFPQEKNQYGPVTCSKTDFFAFSQRIAKMCKKLYF
jgi:hypothetical protein